MPAQAMAHGTPLVETIIAPSHNPLYLEIDAVLSGSYIQAALVYA